MMKVGETFSEPLKVLLVEDNLLDLKLLERMLSSSPTGVFQIKKVKTLKDTIQILDEHPMDVIVLDLNLPDSRGVDTLIKLHEKYPAIAVVVNTGAYEDDLGLKTMSMGAQDFIVKGKYKAYGLSKAIYYAKERKRFELELRAVYTSLQEAQAQLIQAEKMNVIGRLASGVAHEVKNPLATILFGVAYLHERVSSDDEKVALTLSSISEAAKKANEIVKDLLDFSSLSQVERRPEDVSMIVDKALALTNHQLVKKNIHVTRDFHDNVPRANVDRNRMEQVFVNLILNAVQAMPNSGDLTLKIYKQTSGNGFPRKDLGFAPGTPIVCIEVEDNGAGIPEDKVEKIFDPFFTTKRATGGVGLGLSVAKNIIDMHSGKIYVENRKDHNGTRATVVLKV